MINRMPSYYDESNKIWSGDEEEPYYHDNCSIGRIAFNTMKNYPKNVIQIFSKDDVPMTNGEAIVAAIRIAQHFKTMGLHQADIVGIAARNSSYVLPVALSCLLNCITFHAVNPTHEEKTLTHMFGITKPKVIFCDGQDYDKIRLVTKQYRPKVFTLTEHIDNVPKVQDLLLPTTTEHFFKPETLLQGGDQTIAILCTSGTTGMPKGVCLSNKKLMSFTSSRFLNSEDVIYCSSGIDWLTGLSMTLLCCTIGCTRIISDKKFSAEDFVRLVMKYKITFSFMPPRHIAALIKCPAATPESLTSMRLLNSGGSIITLSTLEALQRIVKNAIISFFYGMTEIGTVAANFGLDRTTSVGKVATGIRVRIVDKDGNNLGPNKVGEIYLQQTKEWHGYYGDAMATQHAFDKQGWYHTGDMGYFDDEHFLYVVDRKKELLKYEGMHYWPAEIEKCLLELPDIKDVCVIGIYDESNGDLAGALVVKTKGSTLSAENIRDYVKKKLVVPHKQLHAGVVFVEKLPRNQNEKIIRTEAKKLFIATMSKVDVSDKM